MFIAAGCNALTHAADWSQGQLAYGAGRAVAIYQEGLLELHHGHTTEVTAVLWAGSTLISGAAEVIVWGQDVRLKIPKPCSALSYDAGILVVGCLDGKLYIYKDYKLEREISLGRHRPLALALKNGILAVGSTAGLDIFTLEGQLLDSPRGHEDWVRDVAWSEDGLLASASQDRTARLWRVIEGKAQFEALLIAHEDWIMSCRFQGNRLLTAGADSAVVLWRQFEGVWSVDSQLGLVSAKGSTTATGSVGGFWGAGFAGELVYAWNRTGAIRFWRDGKAIPGIGGHTSAVRSVSWAGSAVLTSSTDQTTRLWANLAGWREVARPQVHGYDLVSARAVSTTRFVSAAEEKLLRVFQMTKTVGDLLSYDITDLPDAAAVPLLGLSNKGGEESEETEEGPLSMTEDSLQRHTLFAELAKLYGHGNACAALAVSPDGRFAATSCRAQTPDQAAVRVYSLDTFDEIAQLRGHNLTVTAIAFGSRHMLTCSRDRSIALFELDGTKVASVQRAHKRSVLDGCWWDDRVLTVSRDGLKVWRGLLELEEHVDVGSATAVTSRADRIYVGLED
ncbi:Elongator subunit elp2, partial [Savitreella phatthalungensis]